MDFGNPQYHEVMFYGNVEKIFFKSDVSLLNVVKSLSTYLGTMPPLPDWVTDGMILGVQGGTDVVSILLSMCYYCNFPLVVLAVLHYYQVLWHIA